MRLCEYCGADLPGDARFCGRCGRVQSDQPVENSVTSNEPVLPAGTSPDDPFESYPIKRSNRKPYRYTPLAAGEQAQPYAQSYTPTQQSQPNGRAQSYTSSPQANQSAFEATLAAPQTAYAPQNQSPSAWQSGASPAGYPSGQPYPSQPPLVVGNGNNGNGGSAVPIEPGTGKKRSRRRKGCLISSLVVLVLLVVLGAFAITTLQKALAFGSAISTQSPLSTQTGYMNTSDRVNILLMGYGGAGHDGAYLTDSLVIMSLIPSTHHTTLISVPRDLWVQYPPNSGNYTKINAIYTMASNGKPNSVAGGDALAQKVSLVTGLTINYWMSINFAGFRKFIDAIGGVDINVPDAFTAKYPKNDDPSINASWITVHFNKGMQHMNGATAIVYARARYVLDNPAEGSDFARSQRQQLIMKAALTRLKDWHNWPSLFSAMDALKQTLYSNLSLADLAQFALKMDLTNAHRLGLTNDNVLTDATSNDGQSILLPRNNNWQAIIDYVKNGLYS